MEIERIGKYDPILLINSEYNLILYNLNTKCRQILGERLDINKPSIFWLNNKNILIYYRSTEIPIILMNIQTGKSISYPIESLLFKLLYISHKYIVVLTYSENLLYKVIDNKLVKIEKSILGTITTTEDYLIYKIEGECFIYDPDSNIEYTLTINARTTILSIPNNKLILLLLHSKRLYVDTYNIIERKYERRQTVEDPIQVPTYTYIYGDNKLFYIRIGGNICYFDMIENKIYIRDKNVRKLYKDNDKYNSDYIFNNIQYLGNRKLLANNYILSTDSQDNTIISLEPNPYNVHIVNDKIIYNVGNDMFIDKKFISSQQLLSVLPFQTDEQVVSMKEIIMKSINITFLSTNIKKLISKFIVI